MGENWRTETCCSCHVQFQITADHQGHLKQSHKSFYCPNGHSIYYPGETKVKKLEKELEYKQNHIKRLYDENKGNLKTITDLRKQLKDATEKKAVNEVVKKEERRGRPCTLFNKSQKITTISSVIIWKPIVKYLSENLPVGKFVITDVEDLIEQFYIVYHKKEISKNSIIKYAWANKEHMVREGLIIDMGDGNYQLKAEGEPVEPETPSKKTPVKLSYLEKWLIKKMPRKPFSIEQFYNDYPKQRHHKKNTQAVITDLIKRRIISQLGPDRFKLNSIKQEGGKC